MTKNWEAALALKPINEIVETFTFSAPLHATDDEVLELADKIATLNYESELFVIKVNEYHGVTIDYTWKG